MDDMNDKDLIWTETKRTVLYKTPVFTVTERHSEGPCGITGNYIVNDCMDWGIVIPVIDDSFLMVKQWRHGEKSLSIEFPGGIMENGEDPEKAALRELREETGASSDDVELLGIMNPNPALFSNHVYVYCARNLKFSGKTELDHDEFLNSFKMKQAEVIKGMGTKDFPHALMSSALCLWMARYYRPV